MLFSFWTEAVFTAVYLLNRSATVQLRALTPYEQWYNKKRRQQLLSLQLQGICTRCRW